MALPTIQYNASTGSDTAASGAGPATAVTGTAAAHTGGAASTTITLTNTPDLSGVATDGSAAIWLNTSAGSRHLSKITAVDDGADTVTVEDSFNIAVGSAVDYAIGGIRQTLENDTSNRDWLDAKAGWTLEFDAGNYDITAAIDPTPGDSTDGPMSFVAASGAATRPVIRNNAAGNFQVFNITTGSGGSIYIEGLDLLNLQNWGGASALKIDVGQRLVCVNVLFETAGSGAGVVELRNATSTELIRCKIDGRSVATEGITNLFSGQRPQVCIAESEIVRINGDGIAWSGLGTFANFVVERTSFRDCGTGIDVNTNANSNFRVSYCTFENMTTDGITVGTNNPDANGYGYTFTHNVFYGCIYGIDVATAAVGRAIVCAYNAFGLTTSGQTRNIGVNRNAVTLTADPFVDRTNHDFEPNETAGGGALLRNAAFTGALSGDYTSYLDIGAVRHQDPAGGGGSGGTGILRSMIIEAA